MKIAVLIYSRNRAEQLARLIANLQDLESGQHEVNYYVTYCPGDLETWSYLVRSLTTTIGICRVNDQVMLGEAINDALAKIRYDSDPDYYVPLADDIVPLTQHWDNAIHMIDEKRIPAFCWCELNDPHNTAYISFSKAYYEGIWPRAVPEYFPFWFIDTWQAEVYLLAFGEPIPMAPALSLGGKRGVTQGLRDVAFWFEYFAATRDERCLAASKLARSLGRQLPSPESSLSIVRVLQDKDKTQLERSAQYEQSFGAAGKPPETYYESAYLCAVAHMNAISGA